jgi:hypothetical protein
MRRTTLAACLAAVAVAATGCTSSTDSSSDFSGEEKKVAETIEDLQDAAVQREPGRVCDDVLASALVRRLGRRCSDVVKQAFDDTDDPDLTVTDVRISGRTARARVEVGRDKEEATTLELVRERDEWRISSFGG